MICNVMYFMIPGDRSPSTRTFGITISDKERFSERCHALTVDEKTGEDELMEWEPIEDEKILSHVRIVILCNICRSCHSQ
jgi:hypothetical protein